MSEYDFRKIEEKWKKENESKNLYKTSDDFSKQKHYVLDMFPYPSGEGLHIGHARIYTASDIYTRMRRMQGFNVLHPTGWDAFGLPAEDFAIKNKIHPRISTDKNINNFRKQMKMLDISYDFDREIDTTDPQFYKWTQWIFLQMYKKGLAYESYEPINWCPSCQTGLANEDLENGHCERCGSDVEQKPMRQWVLRITNYADRMLEDLETLSGWPEWTKELQRNWIGKSSGAEFEFKLENNTVADKVKIFTTRPDTLFGASYVAISAELAKSWMENGWEASDDIKTFIDSIIEEQKKDTFNITKEKKGIFTSVLATNPANNKRIPVWIANYVLGGVGTGAIMAVPAHDERDFEFAKEFGLHIEEVIDKKENILPFIQTGTLINSEKFDGMTSIDAKVKITEEFSGKLTTRYKLQDWVFSRQRYWGEPIPIVHDEHGEAFPLHESMLPVVLPQVENYAPSGTGESPLVVIDEWMNVLGYVTDEDSVIIIKDAGEIPTGKQIKKFRRESNTMPQWAGSSWYYLRFADNKNDKELISKDKEKYWQPVDVYVGGAEHATRHLIYARFYHKFLYDIGAVSNIEPFMRFESVGLVMGKSGVKMSKRLGNVINPDDVVKEWGTDTVRTFIAFMGSFYDRTPWEDKAIIGCERFLERVWKARTYVVDHEVKDLNKVVHQTVKKVTEDIAVFKFNTAVSQLMICLNAIENKKEIGTGEWAMFIKMLAPFATSMSEELWQILGNDTSIHTSAWPKYNEELITEDTVTIALQIAGKLRGTFEVPYGSSEDFVKEEAKKLDGYKKYVGEVNPKKIIVIQNKIVNVVI